MRKKIVELSNIEIHEHCLLNIETGEKKYNKDDKKVPYFTGYYFRDKATFFALYSTEKGPMMYYEGKEYRLKKELHISLVKKERWREFRIDEYDIHIVYQSSQYIGFDVWSEEEDVDLFFQIEQFYKDDEYYKKFMTVTEMSPQR